MSFNLRNIREIANDPLTKFTNEIAKKLSAFLTKGDIDQLEDNEDIYADGQDMDTILKFHDELSSTNKFDGTIQYYPTFEPDGVINTCWIKGMNLGNTSRDISGFGNTAMIYGEPLLIDGTPFDLGIHVAGTKSVCRRFNAPTSDFVNEEWIQIPDAANMEVLGIATGISYFVRFRVFDLANQGGINRTLFQKYDDASNGVIVKLGNDGKLLVFVRRAGTDYKQETASGAIVVNTVYELFITYSVSGNVIHVYLNNVDKTLSASADSPNIDTGSTDTFIFRRGLAAGFVYGDFYDFMTYRERILTSNIIGNSVQFDGSNDFIDLTNDASLWSQSLTQFSFSFWAYPTTNSGGITRDVVNHGTGASNGFRCIQFNNDMAWKINFGAGESNVFGNYGTINTWSHFVCTYDSTLGSNQQKIYRNGTLLAQGESGHGAINLSTAAQLAGGGSDFQGNMRDFRWWTTKALTQTEITDVYNNSVNAPLPDYWLKMVEGIGNPVDRISGTKIGTLTNGAFWITDEVGNHFRNKWTIAPIDFGHCMITNYWATYSPAPIASFTTTSYTSTSYDV